MTHVDAVGTVRRAAVAGSFYPEHAQALREAVRECFDGARHSFASSAMWPKVLIVPHAGYAYSGPVAASAFLTLRPGAEVIDRVVLLGPSHRVPFEGLAVPRHRAFETPFGRISIDETSRQRALQFPFVQARDDAHRWEHSLEVQLPFLQEVLSAFTLLPIVVGYATANQVSLVLDALWDGDETVVVISSDLSHYHDYETAKRFDASTAHAIEALAPSEISEGAACGRVGVQGTLQLAKTRGLEPRRLDLRSSGDTAGGRDEVVGYGAWAFTASRNGSP